MISGALPSSPVINPVQGTSVPPRPQAETGERGEARPTERPEQASRGAQADTQLTEAELKELTKLKARDREVRAHETAHQSVGGQYAGAPSYTYQRGPDGAQYAVGGEVSIDIAPVEGDPQATIDKMRIVRAAALAPAEPSSQDRAVAAEATQILLQAQVEQSRESRESSDDEAANEVADRQGDAAADTYRSISRSTAADQPADLVGFQATA
ncbi:putative metalloprotease CJM1_0395 family protein [Marinobacter xestospongiae]|uniref:Metalloprotease CJM1_0395 family protein n=1 Tax=Marinobacter xestospongiae TaxID=994319 RepID=A0ABU3VTY2_9GAMM|nr:putative metalloprotease CJM1_0395 family protein [Marinobacter xestospongiae]MDV2077726.1 putative metalloprotease CJM1_0395 family protein [Marinobacter xestospongiae]